MFKQITRITLFQRLHILLDKLLDLLARPFSCPGSIDWSSLASLSFSEFLLAILDCVRGLQRFGVALLVFCSSEVKIVLISREISLRVGGTSDGAGQRCVVVVEGGLTLLLLAVGTGDATHRYYHEAWVSNGH